MKRSTLRKMLTSVSAVFAAAAAVTLTSLSAAAADPVYGDVNGDGSADMADVVAIMRWNANPDEFSLTAEQKDRGDVYERGDGLTNSDALTIQRYVAGLIDSLPESWQEGSEVTTAPAQTTSTAQTFTTSAPSQTRSTTQTTTAAPETTTSTTTSAQVDDPVTDELYIRINGTSAETNAPSDTVSISGGIITITREGTFTVTGSGTGVQINVNVDKTAFPDSVVELDLEGASITNENDSPIYVTSVGDEVVIVAKNGTENTITDGTAYTNADGSQGAVYSCDDLKIKGKGKLIVNGKASDGIVCKDDLKIQNGTIEVNAADDGIRGKDSVRIGDNDDRSNDGTLMVTVRTENGDGIKSSNTEDESKGYIEINGGTVDIDSHADGISAARSVTVNGGDINIKTYEGSEYAGASSGQGTTQPTTGETTQPTTGETNPWEQQSGETDPSSGSRPSRPGSGGTGGTGGFGGESGHDLGLDFSCKGIKAGDSDASIDGDITVSGGTVTLNTTDDAVHCGGTMTINGGEISIVTADDALHCDKYMNINDGKIVITKSYEGLEAMQIRMTGGDVTVYSEDDPFNAGEKGVVNQVDVANDNCLIQIDGGVIHAYVTNTREGDGIDSNGKIVINGGEIYVEGSVDGPDSALDSDGEMIVNGGIVVAVGGLGRGELPETSSKQNSLYWGDSGTSYPSGTVVALLDQNGNVILSYTSVQTLKCAVISCPEIKTGGQYSISVNGNIVASFTVSSALMTQGDIGSGGGGGGGFTR